MTATAAFFSPNVSSVLDVARVESRASTRTLPRRRRATIETVTALNPVSRAVVRGNGTAMYTAQNIFKRYPWPFRYLEERAFQRVSAFYPCSSEAAQVIRDKGFKGPSIVIPLGVSPVVQSRRRSGAFRVGFVGRLEPYKGPSIALQSFAEAALDDAQLVFVGDGSQRSALEALAFDLNVAPQISFVGAVSQTEALEHIAAFDVLLVPSLTSPSWKEQFGRVAAQAMAAGTVVVASDSGSLREVVDDTGCLVSEGDTAGFSACIRRLEGDRPEFERLARAACGRASQHFLWPAVAESVAAMYDGALQTTAPK